MEHMTSTPQGRVNGGLRLGSRLVLLAFLAIGGFFLITEHAAHLFGVLPYLLVLLCPLLHLLHGGHGHHDSHHTHTEGDKS
jgi:hypothetical protein